MPTGMDTLSADAVAQGLNTQVVGRNVLYYPSLTSTMDIARQGALAGAAEGTVVIAGRQTAGRGRLKRAWFAPTGNIALSVILYPRAPDLPSLVMLASLGAVHAIRAVTGITGAIKWPNDVLIDGRKVCGILIETSVQRDTVAYAVIGIGVNVSLVPADFPEIAATAASLSALAGEEISRVTLTRELLRQLDRLYVGVRQGDSVFEEWRASLVTLGQTVRVKSAEDTRDGLAEAVDRDGTLLLRSPDGKLTRIFAGDVTLGD